jgi:hypothetical protein
VVVRLGTAPHELEGLPEVRLQLHDDPATQRDDSLLLPLPEDGELPAGEVEVSDTDAAELGAADSAVEENEQGEAIACGSRAAKEQLVDVGREERRHLPRCARRIFEAGEKGM